MDQNINYKNHTIRIQPHHDRCSEYAFTIIDPEGNEIKHVYTGGDTQETALSRAQEMIDMELHLQKEV